jgi:uncharacterized protein
MKLEQSFEVDAPLDEVWEALVDVEHVAPCIPGAAITGRNEDGSYNGTFTIKIGPTTASYAGRLEMQNLDEAAHIATMHAHGSDRRGQGGATATIVSTLSPRASGTRVEVVTDYHITGRLARFGRGGMIEDISERLLRDFAGRLQASLVTNQASNEQPTVEVQGLSEPAPAEAVPAPTEARVEPVAAGEAAPGEGAGVGEGAGAGEGEGEGEGAGGGASGAPGTSAEPPRGAPGTSTDPPRGAPGTSTEPPRGAPGTSTEPPRGAPGTSTPATAAGRASQAVSASTPAGEEAAPPPPAPAPPHPGGAPPRAAPPQPSGGAPPPPPPPPGPPPSGGAPPPPPPPPRAAPPPPPPAPPRPPSVEPAAPLDAFQLAGGVMLDRIRRNPAPVIAVVGGLIAWRILRHRRRRW